MADFSLFGQAPAYFDWTQYQRSPATPAPAATGLTFEDLYRPAARPQYPEPPKPYASFGDLGEDAKKTLRREAILRAAMALGGDSGQIGTNLAKAALSVGDWKDQQLEVARQRQQQDYALSARQAEFEADRERFNREDERNKVEVQGRLRAVQAIIDAEPEWGARAEAAALQGDDEGLRKMLSEAETRRQIRASGGDPNDPLWDDRRKEEMKRESDREQEKWLKEQGLGRYYEDEPTLEEIEARSAAAARGQRSVWGDRGGAGGEAGQGRLYERQDGVYRVNPDGTSERIEGIPAEKRWTMIPGNPITGDPAYWTTPEGDVRMVPPGPAQVIEKKESELKRPLSEQERSVLQKQWGNKATPMVYEEVVSYAQQQLGRQLTAKERKEVEGKWKTGMRPGLIVEQMKGPKPPAPNAPSQGQVRRPQPKQNASAALPPPLRRTAVSERDKATLRDKVKQRFPNLTPAEQEEKYKAALRLLEQGG